MPVGILYVDDAFYFNAGPKTRKARNIARNPNCVITIATHDFGLTAKYSAPSAGPPPWHVYEVRPETIFALGTSEPYGATRWNFQTETDGK